MAEDGWLKTPYDLSGKRVWIAGHAGMVGSALVRHLKTYDCTMQRVLRCNLDLTRQEDVEYWMSAHKPEVVILAAAKVGGIGANVNYPAEFIYENMMIEANIIHSAYKCGVEKLLFLGSSCIYPKDAAQPITEEALLSGALEPTNEPYALAKIAGLKMCGAYRAQYNCDFISAMPCNLYGEGDRFDLRNSHVIPSLMMKAHAAKVNGDKSLSVWGSGEPLREFLHVDDLAQALVFMLQNYSGASHVNIGSGQEISIAALAQKIANVVGFDGVLKFDETKSDGASRKVMDSRKIMEAGWSAKIALPEGLEQTYDWYLKEAPHERAA